MELLERSEIAPSGRLLQRVKYLLTRRRDTFAACAQRRLAFWA
jgi:hypothetical protein